MFDGDGTSVAGLVGAGEGVGVGRGVEAGVLVGPGVEVALGVDVGVGVGVGVGLGVGGGVGVDTRATIATVTEDVSMPELQFAWSSDWAGHV
jgi:hypothetical protein